MTQFLPPAFRTGATSSRAASAAEGFDVVRPQGTYFATVDIATATPCSSGRTCPEPWVSSPSRAASSTAQGPAIATSAWPSASVPRSSTRHSPG